MKHRTLPLLGLLALGALGAGLGACTDEKKGDPPRMTPPAPAADPTKPDPGKPRPKDPE